MRNAQKKKILIVTDYFYPHWTGLSKSMFNLIKQYRDTFSFTVLTVQSESDLKREEIIEGARVVRAPYIFSFSRSKYSIIILNRFISLIRKNDVVLINSPCTNILPYAILTKLFRKKLFIFHQGDLILPKGILNKMIEIVFDITSFIACNFADKVSTYTEDYAKHSRLLRHFLFKFSPLLLPVVLSRKAIMNRKLLDIKQKKGNGYIILGFAGRFVEEKGFDVLFDAIPRVLEEISNAHFVFAGKTNMGYENFFQKNMQVFERVKRHISLLGLLDDNQMHAFYKIIDFIIIPSRSDCFNLVQAEAMLSGVPSIVSNIPGARSLVANTSYGVIFEKENANDLAKNTLYAIRHIKKIQSFHGNILKVLSDKNNEKNIMDFFLS